jgi:hypothetical protein
MPTLDPAQIEIAIKVLDSVKLEDKTNQLWALIEQRARIKTRVELTQLRLATAPVSVKKAYVEILGNVITEVAGDLSTTCFQHFLYNLNEVKKLLDPARL